MKRNKPRNWNLLTLLAAVIALAWVASSTTAAEDEDGWKKYQIEFLELSVNKAPDGGSMEQWLHELKKAGPSIREATLPEAGIRDKCMTCHLGADNPNFLDAPEPLRTHPGKILQQHPVAKFGCTICHDGN